MNFDEENDLLVLAQREGWQVIADQTNKEETSYSLLVSGRKFPLRHPYEIHITLYRDSKDPDTKFFHMKKAHDYLWPEFTETWNHWDERRFRAHCQGYEQIVLAGPAAAAKSHCTARIACLFYLSDHTRNAVVVASTTLDSLETRIWGYIVKLLDEAALPLPVKILEGKPPKVLPLNSKGKVHGMFAVAISQTDDDTTIRNLIGRHPDKCFMAVLDEAPEMSPSITKAFPNWKKGVDFFQVWAIGNSNSKHDLHGAMATPREGWGSVDRERDLAWPTMHKNGICLYFNPFDSPAIKETDPVKRERLARFLPTLKSIQDDKETYTETSESYWRFTLGFWKQESIENVVMGDKFVSEFDITRSAEWSGLVPLHVVAGLDPAFARGGTGCVLRLGILGHTVDGRVVMDFRGEELLFRIDVNVTVSESGELQLCRGVIEILIKYRCPLGSVTIDATGGGRALGELIRIVSLDEQYTGRLIGQGQPLIKIVSVGQSKGLALSAKDKSIIVATPSDLWFQFKDFITHRQIKGLDAFSIKQFTNRATKIDKKTGKMTLETKDEYKSRMNAIDPKMAHSPDEADAAVLTLHTSIIRHGFEKGQRRNVPHADPAWVEKMLAYEVEQRTRLGLLRGSGNAGGVTERVRAELVPNFSGAIEDIPKPRGFPESIVR